MTVAALILASLACLTAGVALWIAVQSRADSLTSRRELARHRQSHAEQTEERRAGARAQVTLRGTPPPPEPRRDRPQPSRHADPAEAVTGELEAQEPITQAVPAVRLPRPGTPWSAR